jgi:hypothetical protein
MEVEDTYSMFETARLSRCPGLLIGKDVISVALYVRSRRGRSPVSERRVACTTSLSRRTSALR